MTYSEFQAICAKFHEQVPSVPTRFAWKAIQFVHVDTMPSINFANLFAHDKAYFVGTGGATEFTGFVISDVAGAEYSVFGRQTIQYIDLANVIAITFNPNYKWVGELSMKAVKIENPAMVQTTTTRKRRLTANASTYKLKFYYDSLDHVDEGEQFEFTDTATWTRDSSITSVEFDSTFTRATPTNTKQWFKGCTALNTFTGMDNLKFDTVTDTTEMFSGCTALTVSPISGLTTNTEKFTTTKGMFEGCTALTTVSITTWDLTHVTDMSNMFKGCTALGTIEALNTTAYTPTTSTDMFAGDTNLPNYTATAVDATRAYVGGEGYFTNALRAKVVYNNSNTLTFYYDLYSHATEGVVYNLNEDDEEPDWLERKDNVTTIKFDETFANARPTNCYYWFEEFREMNTIEGIRNLNTSAVVNMEHMFYKCESIETIDVLGFDVSAVHYMGSMFDNCKSLNNIDVANWNVSNVTDMSGMFGTCTSLTFINLENWNVSSLDNTTYMFYGCTELANICAINDNAWTPSSSTGMFTNCTKLPNFPASPTAADLTAVRAHVGGDGYFTDVRTAKAVFNANTLTFYYDNVDYEGTTYPMNTGYSMPGWLVNAAAITTVTFNSTFANYRPTTCCRWFDNFVNLTTINGINYLVTSSCTNMAYMFNKCSILTVLDVSGFNTSAVTDMQFMFYGSHVIGTLNVSAFNTANVTTMKSMFEEYSGSELNVAGFNTTNVTDMANMFAKCVNLTTLNLSAWNTANVTNMSGMFSMCHALATITGIESLNVHSVTTMQKMFEECNALTTMNLSTWDTSSCDNKDYMFYACENLTQLNLQGFNDKVSVSMNYMFAESNKLGTILEVNTDAWSATYSEKMFYNCTALPNYDATATDVTRAHIGGDGYFTPAGPKTSKAVFNTNTLTFYHDYNTHTSEGTVYSLNTGTTEPGWLVNRGSIVTVTFDSSFADARPTTCYKWFDWHYNTTTINNITNLNTSEVTNMSYMFGLPKVTSLDLSGFDTSKVTDMSWMFNSCGELTSLDLSTFNTNNVTNMSGMFSGCKKVTSLNVSGFNTNNVTNMSYMFTSCEELASLNMSGFNTSSVTNMEDMFSSCIKLTSIDVFEFNTSNVTNMNNMFAWCENLGTIGATNTTAWTPSTSTNMFGGCTRLPNYEATIVDATKAYINSGEGTGYFTDARTAKVVYNTTQKILTFYFDALSHTSEGTVYSLNTGTNTPGWYADRLRTFSITFDSSFADARPTTCYNWFSDFDRITTINGISNLNTSKVTNMYAMFSMCQKLTSLDVSGFDTSKVVNMHNMFNYCQKLTSLDVSGFDTSNVVDMYSMFGSCAKITSLDVSGFDTSNVGNMYGMFCCVGVTSLDVSGWDVSNVSDMRRMFASSLSLATIKATNITPWSPSISTGMFSDCTALPNYKSTEVDATKAHCGPGGYFTDPRTAKAVFDGTNTLTFYYDELPHTSEGTVYSLNNSWQQPQWVSDYYWKITTVTFDSSFASARPAACFMWFTQCNYLSTVNGISNLNTSNCTTMKSMFSGCWSLTSLDVSGFRTSNVTNMTQMFDGCSNILTLDVSGWDVSNVSDMTQMFDDCSKLETIKAVNTTAWAPATSTNMFYNCTALPNYEATIVDATKAYINSGEGTGYFTDARTAKAVYNGTNTLTFYYDALSHTSEGTVYGLNSGTTEPGWLANRYRIYSVIFDSTFANYRPVTCYHWFYNSAISRFNNLNNLNTSQVTNMAGMFAATSFSSIDLTGLDVSNVTDMTEMFYCVNNSDGVTIDITGWDVSKVTTTDRMFSGCSHWFHIYSPNKNAWTPTSSVDMFKNSRYLPGYDATTVDATKAHSDVGGYFRDRRSAKAVYVESTRTLTFYYDRLSHSEGTVYQMNTGEEWPDWEMSGDIINNAVFDSSFADARPTSCYCWFGSQLNSITGTENLNTKNVTTMDGMFGGAKITSLDISTWDVSKVNNTSAMFYNCPNLNRIYATNTTAWTPEESTNMFYNCTKLPNYNSSKVDASKAYAGGDGQGYFTLKT